MSIVARHKKPGGFRKLVNSLETTPPERRTKILDSLRIDDAAFTDEVEAALFAFEEFKDVPDLMVAELVFQLKNEITALALALYHCKDEELVDKFTRNMAASIAVAYRDAVEILSQVTVGQQVGGRFRVIQKARELQHQGIIFLKKYSDHYQDE
jgi:flagellar motor switch protein FliG